MNLKKYIPLIKEKTPWHAKMLAKIITSRLPGGYRLLHRFNLSDLGKMQDPNYAFSVFKQHYDRAGLTKGFVGLELGPGDSLFSALTSWAVGSSKCYLIDVADFATKDINSYKAMINFLNEKGFALPQFHSTGEILSHCHVSYLTSGLASLKSIPDNSVDFIWSQAVLEHIRKREFFSTLKELHRISKQNGVSSHEIDLRDHLAFALNNLRFSEKIWESEFMARSGFYTNRIRYQEMLNLFNQAGFAHEVVVTNRWDKLPTPRSAMAKEFSCIPEEDLCLSGFTVILRPNK